MSEVYIVHLRSYGHLHPGKERWRNVIKRCWNFVPGSALYGAVCSALIRLTCIGVADAQRCSHSLEARNQGEEPICFSCDYLTLLELVAGGQIRFSPLVPSESAIETALGYCRAAAKCLRATRKGVEPHLAVDRQSGTVHGELLYGIQAHELLSHYYGFILAPAQLEGVLQRALRVFPAQPFGGKGKFALVEAEMHRVAEDEFLAELRQSIVNKELWLELLTPIACLPGEAMFENWESIRLSSLRRYRVWRTGLYLGAWEDPPTWKTYGLGTDDEQSEPFLGMAEGASFKVRAGSETKAINDFLHGVGDPRWTYLGWGQVIFDV